MSKAIEPQSADSIAALLLREAKGRKIELLAPLVVSRKGYYTDLAQWALAKGYAELRVDGTMRPTAQWPRLDRFREHTIELPVGTVKVGAATEAPLRAALDRALEFGKGVAHIVDKGRTRVFSTRRACPSCARSFAEPDPRMFSYNSRHGWCEECFGTGLQISGFDDEQSGEEAWWNDWVEGEAAPNINPSNTNDIIGTYAGLRPLLMILGGAAGVWLLLSLALHLGQAWSPRSKARDIRAHNRLNPTIWKISKPSGNPRGRRTFARSGSRRASVWPYPGCSCSSCTGPTGCLAGNRSTTCRT